MIKNQTTSFYIRVYPFVLPSIHDAFSPSLGDEENDPNIVKYRFELAFYDEEQLIDLKEGEPQRGLVTNQTFVYFKLSNFNSSFDYEISLTPITGGNPDLLISFNESDKFPTLGSALMSSTQFISTDSLDVNFTGMTPQDRLEAGLPASESFPIYIGVFTADPYSVFNLVIFKKTEFNPIRLEKDTIIASRLTSASKYFYTVA